MSINLALAVPQPGGGSGEYILSFSPDWWMVVLTLALLVISACAVWVTFSQLKTTRQSHYASLVLEFLDRYSSRDMLESLAELREFCQNEPQLIADLDCLYSCVRNGQPVTQSAIDAAKLYNKNFESKVGKPGTIGEHRARVSWFFSKAWRLHHAGLIDDRTLGAICALDGVGVFLKVAVPTTLAIRLDKIHKLDVGAFTADPNVKWFSNVEDVHKSLRKDLRDLY